METSFNKKAIIAVDGYSSCGKSTFAKAIAARRGYIFIDTGAMYRAATLAALRAGLISEDNIVDVDGINKLIADGVDIHFVFNNDRDASDIYIGDECVEEEIRAMEVSSRVSLVAAVGAVRNELVSIQQRMGADGGVVMDGRDIGTAVFPNAEIKIFMTADVDVRAMRRYKEIQSKGGSTTLEEIKINVASRDRMDEEREISPLRRAEDALLLDNSYMSVEEQMDWFEERFNSQI